MDIGQTLTMAGPLAAEALESELDAVMGTLGYERVEAGRGGEHVCSATSRKRRSSSSSRRKAELAPHMPA